MADYLEPGLTPITDPWQVIAGGVDLTALGITRIEGLEDIVETTGDAPPTGMDGSHPSPQRLMSRKLTITMDPLPNVQPGTIEGWSTWVNNTVDLIKTAFTPLPDRGASRLLRFRLPGYPQARRLTYRPVTGQRPIEIVTSRERVTFARPSIIIRIEALDPVIYSDLRHDLTISANQTATVRNAGTFTAVLPTAWEVTSTSAITVRHLNSGESVRVAGSGSGTRRIRTTRAVSGPGTRLALSGTAGLAVPRWPLLRPGNNSIQPSARCTFSWRDTFA